MAESSDRDIRKYVTFSITQLYLKCKLGNGEQGTEARFVMIMRSLLTTKQIKLVERYVDKEQKEKRM